MSAGGGIHEGHVLACPNTLLIWGDRPPPQNPPTHPVIVLGQPDLMSDAGIAWVVPCSNRPRFRNELYAVTVVCRPGSDLDDGLIAMPFIAQPVRYRDISACALQGHVTVDCLAEVKAVVADALNLIGSRDWGRALNAFFEGASTSVLESAIQVLREMQAETLGAATKEDIAHVLRVIARMAWGFRGHHT